MKTREEIEKSVTFDSTLSMDIPQARRSMDSAILEVVLDIRDRLDNEELAHELLREMEEVEVMGLGGAFGEGYEAGFHKGLSAAQEIIRKRFGV